MTDDLSLDFEVVDEQLDELVHEPDPWLARRLLTIGASEVPALYLALGLVVVEEKPPRWLEELSKNLLESKATTWELARLKASKQRERVDDAAMRGNEVERELLEEWNRTPFSGWPEFVHADTAPREWYPLVDRLCPKLSFTPDCWCYLRGMYVNGQVKATVKADAPLGAWYHRLQVQAEMAVTGATCSVLIYGPGWAASWGKRRAPVAVTVERDDEEIQRIRDAVTAGWAIVERKAGER